MWASLPQAAEAASPIDATTYTVSVTTRSANPRQQLPSAGGAASQQGPSAQDLKNEAIERLKETRAVLQGLVNLSRGTE